MVGQVVADRYELDELVGTGGMSSVYRAHDSLLERNVAIKVLHEHVGRDAEQVERFRREARAVAQLSHPNIVTVIDRGERDGREYIVFEYVEGENLKQLVLRGPLTVRRALDIAIEIARGLEFAHRQGLIHRDVKPQNVLLPSGGEAKVTDFGIARELDVHGLTQTGSVLGTSHYIAPEQARGGAVDERTDVYALGAVLYELLTGRVPFDGDNFVSVALKHVHEEVPSAHELRPEVSPRLDAAVQRAMAKDPAERFASMADFELELEACRDQVATDEGGDPTMVVPAVIRHQQQQPSKAPARRRRGLALPLVLSGLAAALAAVAFALVHWGVPEVGSGGAKTRTSGGGKGGGTPQPVRVSAVRSWDPFGDNKEENPASVPNATDGDPGTYWSTESYDATLAALDKPGVGIVLDAGRDHPLATVRIRSDTPGFAAVIKTGTAETGPFDPASASRLVGSDTTFTLASGTHGRYLLIWITALAHPDRYRAHINEVTATG
jgi:eukaryotic-like serine/threonine-protein kinase